VSLGILTLLLANGFAMAGHTAAGIIPADSTDLGVLPGAKTGKALSGLFSIRKAEKES